MSMLAIDIRHRIGDMAMEARFASEGPVTALFGRSGSGKTTLVNMIAGLVRPDAGRIALGETTFVDTGSNHYVPVHQRRIGYVFQEARLFPHLTVRQNLRFSGRFGSVRIGDEDFGRVVDLLGLGALLRRWPAALSGGEKQRVAIGRALLANPHLLLMDEPLASLDEERKDEILSYIERIKASMQVPIVYVSHAVPEIIRLATHVAYLDGGVVRAFGPLESMLGRVGAGFAEPSALLNAEVTGFDPTYGLIHVMTPAGRFEIARNDIALHQRFRLRLLASDVMLARQRPTGISAQNMLDGTVAAIAPVPASGGARVDVALDCNGATILARVTAKAVQQLGLAPGVAAVAVVKSVAIEY